MTRKSINRLCLTLTLLLGSRSALSQNPPPQRQSTPSPPTETPVGHWVAEHPSRSDIGTWWDFRPDGTLTMHIGAIVSDNTVFHESNRPREHRPSSTPTGEMLWHSALYLHG